MENFCQIKDKKEKTENKKHLLKNIRRTLGVAWQSDKWLFFLVCFLALIGAAFPIVLSYLFKIVLDKIIEAKNVGQVITFSLFSLFAFRYIVNFLTDIKSVFHYEYVENIFWKKFENKLTLDFLKKISQMDIPHFENSETQNLILKARQSYPWRHNNFIFNTLYCATSTGTFVGALIALLPFGIWIPFAMVAATLPRFYLRGKYTEIEWRLYNEKIIEAKELSYLRGLLDEPSNIKEIKVVQAENHLLDRVKKLQDFIFETFKKPLRKYLPSFYGAVLLEIGTLFLLAYFKLPAVVLGLITVGSFTFYIQMLDQISRSVQEIVSQFSRLNENSLFVGYYFDALELPKVIIEKEPGFEFEKIEPPEIEFRNVSFKYEEKGTDVLKDISFKLMPSEHLAIVGPNGAGKTTMIRLLLRFYDVQKGEILVNGIDLKDIKIAHWYKFISILFQDFVKFLLSVKDNILMGNTRNIDERKMREAAEKSGAAEFIENLPKKYEQRLGKRFEDSVELSQGQWQKLSLARAFYEEAPILILDEPTSAIDADAEAEIFDNLYKLYKDKTLILISHRFSTVRNADKIIVLEKGQIVEEGNHKSLMKRNGVYARMFTKQARGYLE